MADTQKSSNNGCCYESASTPRAFVRLYRAAHELDATPAPAQPAAGEAVR